MSYAGDWPHWRGPLDLGIAEAGPTPPTQFSDQEKIVWKTTIPGRGHSSPTVIGNKVVLTTADLDRQTQSVLCFDRRTGKPLWTTLVNRGGLPEKIHSKNTHATPTVACDGRRLFVAFHNHDSAQLTALDLSGKILWKKLGPYVPDRYKFGYAPSPLSYDDLVILAAEYEEGYLVALRKK
ncbi:MAG: PQQ-binding-like beta-propeller repeat protein, partial [Blastopirellula sp. JB062]